MLQPVLDYDSRHNGQLLTTVEKYLACERNLALADRISSNPAPMALQRAAARRTCRKRKLIMTSVGA